MSIIKTQKNTFDSVVHLNFDGINDYLENTLTTPLQSWDKEQPWTFFLKLEDWSSTGEPQTRFDNRGPTSPQGRLLLIRLDQIGRIDILIQHNSSNRLYITTQTVSSAANKTIQITYNGQWNSGSSIKVLENGNELNYSVIQNNLSVAQSTMPIDGRVRIGRDYFANARYMKGALLNMSFVDYEKTTGELTTDRTNGFQSEGSGNYLFNLHCAYPTDITSLDVNNPFFEREQNVLFFILGKNNPLSTSSDFTGELTFGTPTVAIQNTKKIGKVLSFDGVNDHLESTQTVPYTTRESDQPFTFSVNLLNYFPSSNDDTIFDNRFATNFRGLLMWIDSSNRFRMNMRNINNTEIRVFTNFGILNFGQGFLTMTYDGSRNANGIQMFLNGNPVSFSIETNNLDSGTITGADKFTVAGKNVSSSSLEYLQAAIPHISFVDFVKTADEIREDVNRGIQSAGTGNYLLRIDTEYGEDILSLNPNDTFLDKSVGYEISIKGKPNPMNLETDFAEINNKILLSGN